MFELCSFSLGANPYTLPCVAKIAKQIQKSYFCHDRKDVLTDHLFVKSSSVLFSFEEKFGHKNKFN